MASNPPTTATQEFTQLAQVKVPLDQADDAFMVRDSSGRIPIVIVPEHPSRIRNGFLFAGLGVLAASIIGSINPMPFWTIFPGTTLALVLIVLGVFRSFLVPIPEGANGLLARGGRYERTIGSGTHIVKPWIAVSHLVTRREIPFDVQVSDAPTSDTVRVSVDALLTFTIDEPFRFVFNIAADDFDEVLQAACQEAIRALVRRVTVDEVFNFVRQDTDEVRETIAPDVASYGVVVKRVRITFVMPPPEFLLTEEQRQLAVRQLAEQDATQVLAERRQEDTDVLERKRLLARAERVGDSLKLQQTEAEAKRRLVELEAEAEALRLARLDERLRDFPLAAEFDVEAQRLEVARALAGNTRAILQIGTADDISRVLLMRQSLHDGLIDAAELAQPAGTLQENGNRVVTVPDTLDDGPPIAPESPAEQPQPP